MKNRYVFALVALVAMFATGLAACSGDDDDGGPYNPTAPNPTAAETAAAGPTFPAGSTMANIAAKGKLVVGVKFDQPGFGLKDPATNAIEGLDIDLARQIGAALGLKDDQIEFVEAVSANRIPFLQEDKVDLVIATMTINADRKTQIEFSRPYYLAGQSILVKKDNASINSVADLNGKNVCSVAGSTSETNVKSKAPSANLLSLPNYSACVSSLKDGRVEAVSTDDIILAGFAATDPSIKLVGGQFTQEPYGVGIKKGRTDMAQFVDSVLDKMLADGTWDKIYEKHLGGVEGLPKAAEARAKLPAAA